MEHKMLQPFSDSYAEEKKILPKTENFPLVLIAFLPIMHQKKAQEKEKKKKSRANAKISKLLDVMFRAATLMYSTQ